MYRFVDISTGGGGNISGSTTTSTNGSRTLSKSKLSLSTINTVRDESLQRYGKQWRLSLDLAPTLIIQITFTCDNYLILLNFEPLLN